MPLATSASARQPHPEASTPEHSLSEAACRVPHCSKVFCHYSDQCDTEHWLGVAATQLSSTAARDSLHISIQNVSVCVCE